MTIVRVLLAALLVMCALSSNPAYAQGGRTQPLGALSLVGPDGAVGEAIVGAMLAPWQARGGQLRYVGAGSSGQAMRQVAAMRDSAPADLVLLDPQAAEQAYARGLIVRLPRESVPALAQLLPFAREASGTCATIAFDALALAYSPDAPQPRPQGLDALADAPLRDRLALPLPTDLLGAYLVGLLAHAETGDWRLTDAGLRRLGELRGDPLQLESAEPSLPRDDSLPSSLLVTWNSAAQLRREASHGADRLGVVIPREGTMLRPLLMCLSASSTNLRGAYAMLDLVLRPELQAALAAALFLAPARDAVELPATLRARLPDLADGQPNLLLPDTKFLARLRGTISDRRGNPAGGEPTLRN
jgi:ABC-type Fe3+ transport system substrate-binding protein